MSTFVLKREYALQMPTSYVDIDREEMEYVDGGLSWNEARSYVWGLITGALATIIGKGVAKSWVGSVITKAVAGWITSAIDSATIAIMYIPSSAIKGIAIATLGGALGCAAWQLYSYGKSIGKF